MLFSEVTYYLTLAADRVLFSVVVDFEKGNFIPDRAGAGPDVATDAACPEEGYAGGDRFLFFSFESMGVSCEPGANAVFAAGD